MLEQKKWSHVIVHLNPRHVLYIYACVSLYQLSSFLLVY